MADITLQDCYGEVKELLKDYCKDIEFNVFVYYYLKYLDDNDPFASRLRNYIENGAEGLQMTTNEFFIEMLKKAVNYDVMVTERQKRRAVLQPTEFKPGYRSPYLPPRKPERGTKRKAK